MLHDLHLPLQSANYLLSLLLACLYFLLCFPKLSLDADVLLPQLLYANHKLDYGCINVSPFSAKLVLPHLHSSIAYLAHFL